MTNDEVQDPRLFNLVEFKRNIRKFRVWHDIDVATAEFVLELFRNKNSKTKSNSQDVAHAQSQYQELELAVYYLVLFLSYCRSEQHTCLPLNEIEQKLSEVMVDCLKQVSSKKSSGGDLFLRDRVKTFVEFLGEKDTTGEGFRLIYSDSENGNRQASKTLTIGDLINKYWSTEDFRKKLIDAGLLQEMPQGDTSEPKCPLVFSSNAFYIARSYWYEFKVAQGLRTALGLESRDSMASCFGALDEGNLKKLLDLFFAKDKDTTLAYGVNWQKVAVAEAVRHRFAVITGGPGTGKTTSVAKLVSILTAMAMTSQKKLRLGMCAPTGKAADRMVQSFAKNFAENPESGASKAELPELCRKVFGENPASRIMAGFRELKAVTVQAMLGLNPDTTRCRFNSSCLLPFDVIIIDEASMIDLENFSRLLDATGPETRLVFLGDKDQLASVDAGAVLGDICSIFSRERNSLQPGLSKLLIEEEKYIERVCGYELDSMRKSVLHYRGLDPEVSILDSVSAVNPVPVLNPVLVAPGLGTLLHSYRFKSDSAISSLARNINTQSDFSIEEVVKIPQGATPDFVQNKGYVQKFEKLNDLENELDNIRSQSGLPPALWVSSLNVKEADTVVTSLYELCAQAWLSYVIENKGLVDTRKLFEHFNSFRVLTPVNDGVFGVRELNKQIAAKAMDAVQKGFLNTDAFEQGVFDIKWFPGLPYMVTKNNKELGVFNGDIGICVYDNDMHKVVVFENGRMLYLSMLPDIVPAFVLSIHKSQGSEFDHTMVLVPEYGGRLLCRELIYTAVTRAKTLVSILGSKAAIDKAAEQNCVRFSGLATRLYA